MQLNPGTLTRLGVDEREGVALKGGPATARLTYLSGADPVDWDCTGTLPVSRCPERVTVAWELSGITVSAEVDVVESQLCELSDIRAYRETAYQLSDATDADVTAARAKATEVVEQECHRFFTPVLRECMVERTNCTGAKYPTPLGWYAHDLREVVKAEYIGGGDANVTVATAETVDVSQMRRMRPARVTFELGCAPCPSEVRDAVVALAAWYLLPNAGPDNATSTSTDAGVLRFVVGGVGGAATSLPAVNAAIERHGMREWMVR